MAPHHSRFHSWLHDIREHAPVHLVIKFIYTLLGLVALFVTVQFRHWINNDDIPENRESTIDKIKRTHHLTVGYIPYFEMSYRDPKTGEVVGLLPDILVEVVKELGLSRSDISFQETTWRDFALGLNKGKYDLSIAGTFITRERQCAVEFTDKLFCLGNGMLVRKNDRRFQIPADLDDPSVTIAVVQGEQGDEYARQNMHRAKLARLAGAHLTVVCDEVADGRADAALSDQFILSRCVRERQNLEDVLRNNPYYILPISWAVRKSDTEWRDWINRRISVLRDKKWLQDRLAYWGIATASEELCIAPGPGLCSDRPWRNYLQMFFIGIAYTLVVSTGAILLGTIIGALLGLANASDRQGIFRWIRAGTKTYVYIFLAIPALVLIITLHYMGRLSSYSAVATSIIALGLNLSPFAAKIITGGLGAIAKPQLLAAKAAGYDNWAIAMRFKLPLVIRNSWPALFVEYVTTLKLSSLASVIGVTEILFQTQQFIQETYKAEFAYLILMISYLVPVVPASLLLDAIEGRRRQREDR